MTVLSVALHLMTICNVLCRTALVVVLLKVNRSDDKVEFTSDILCRDVFLNSVCDVIREGHSTIRECGECISVLSYLMNRMYPRTVIPHEHFK